MQFDEYANKYFDIVLNVVRNLVVPVTEEDDIEVQEALKNSILGLDGPKSIPRNLSPSDVFVAQKLFSPLSEIMNAQENLENIQIYVQSFPYDDESTSKVHYLKYHIENYLNELYILKNRLIAYLQFIKRAYLKSTNSKHVSSTLKPVFEVVSFTLKRYIEIRGAHVHQNRYSDDDFDRLSRLELLKRGDDDFARTIKFLLDKAYLEIEDKWKVKIEKDLVGINKLLEYFFEQLLIAITDDNELIFPSNIEKV